MKAISPTDARKEFYNILKQVNKVRGREEDASGFTSVENIDWNNL